MRKFIPVLISLSLILCACSFKSPAAGRNIPVEHSPYEKLWSLDIGQEGFLLTQASGTAVFEGGGISLYTIVSPISESNAAITRDESAVKTVIDGIEYYSTSGRIAWDAVDGSSGILAEKHVVWDAGGLHWQINASTGGDIKALEFVTADLANEITRMPFSTLTFEKYGLSKTMESWFVEYLNPENLFLSVTIELQPWSAKTLETYRKEAPFQNINHDGRQYYSHADFTDGFIRILCWETEEILTTVRAWAPYDHKDKFKPEDLDFVGFDLADRIEK